MNSSATVTGCDDIIKRLRGALSSRPTAGPWVVMPANAGEQCVARINSWEAVPPNGVELARDFIDAAYIAAASPDNISALLDRLDKAERENERLRAERDEHARWRVDLADKLHDAESQISAAWAALRRAGIQSEETVAEAIALLHAENERLREDAERLDSGLIRLVDRDEFGESVATVYSQVDLRAEIDAARAAEQPESAE